MPYCFTVVTLTSLLDTPGWSINTLDPGSKIKCLDTFSISTEIVGVPCSDDIETEDFTTAFSGALR